MFGYQKTRFQSINHRSGGFTLIELMIVVAIIAIILTLALPVYSNYTIRAKTGEALGSAAPAKTAISATCIEDVSVSSLNNAKAGYGFGATEYVADIQASGPCTTPVITITTRNTGRSPDPVIVLTGQFSAGAAVITWVCTSVATPNHLLPNACRS